MPNVDDHGLEVLKKAARNIGAQPKQNYALQVYLVNPNDIIGGGGGSTSMTQVKVKKLAAETISALSLVALNSTGQLVLADQQNNSKREVIGLALTGGIAGAEIEVLQFGLITDSFFTQTVGSKIFLGLSGAIVTTPPTTGWLVPIGYVVSDCTLNIDIDTPIYRGV